MMSGGAAIILAHPRVTIPVKALEGFADWQHVRRKYAKRSAAERTKPSGMAAVSEAFRKASSRVEDIDQAVHSSCSAAKIKVGSKERMRVEATLEDLREDLQDGKRAAHSFATSVGKQVRKKRAKPCPRADRHAEVDTPTKKAKREPGCQG